MVWEKVERLEVYGRKDPVTPELMDDEDQFLSLTSLTLDEFMELYGMIEEYMCRVGYREHSKSATTNNYGAGRTHELTLIDRFAITLIQLRGTKGWEAGAIFRVSHSIAKAALKEIVPAIKACVNTPHRVAARLLRQGANASLLDFMPDPEAAIDATVINTTRPPRGRGKSVFYRRKKGTGLNIQTTVDLKGYFMDVAASVPASFHDMKVFKEKANLALLRKFDSTFADNAYTGADKLPSIHIEVASRRPPGGKLTEDALERNRWISSKRFVVERCNAFIKSYGIINQQHWYESEPMDSLLQAICGLINFRTARREKHPINWGNRKRPPRAPVPNPKNRELHPTTSCQMIFDARADQLGLAYMIG